MADAAFKRNAMDCSTDTAYVSGFMDVASLALGSPINPPNQQLPQDVCNWVLMTEGEMTDAGSVTPVAILDKVIHLPKTWAEQRSKSKQNPFQDVGGPLTWQS